MSKHRLRSLLGPAGVSVVLHGALLAVLGTVTWTVVHSPAPDGSRVAIIGSEGEQTPSVADRAADLFAVPAAPDSATAPPLAPIEPGLPTTQDDAPPRSLLTDASALSRLTSDERPDAGGTGATVANALSTARAPGASSSSGAGATASFAGVRARAAARIVYVVDASGSMATSFDPPIATALRASIAQLSTDQRFQVILTRDRPEPAPDLTAFSDAMVAPTPATLDRLDRWLAAVTTSGRSDPRPGLLAALEFEPDLIFILTRSFQRSGTNADRAERISDELLAILNARNPADRSGRRAIVVKTIQFVDPDPTGMLRRLSELHGDGPGSHRLLTLDDLDRINASDPASSDTGADLGDDDLVSAGIDAGTLELAERLGALEASGLAQRVLYGAATGAERVSAANDARAVLELAGTRALMDPTASPARALMAVRASAILAAADRVPPTEDAMTAADRVLPADAVAKAAHDALRLTLDRLAQRDPRPELFAAVATTDDPALDQILPDDLRFERALAALRVAPALGRSAFDGAVSAARVAARASDRNRLLVAEATALTRLEASTPGDPWATMLVLWNDVWPEDGFAGGSHASDDPADSETSSTRLERMHRVAARILSLTEHPAASGTELPGTILFAAGLSSAVSDDPARRALAPELFALAANRPGVHAGDALWERAALLFQSAESGTVPASAINDLRTLAQNHPAHPRAREAWVTAERRSRTMPSLHASVLLDATADDSPAPGPLPERVRAAALAASSLAVATPEVSVPPDPDAFNTALALADRAHELDPADRTQGVRRVLSMLWPALSKGVSAETVPDVDVLRARLFDLAFAANVPERGVWLFQHASTETNPGVRLGVYDRVLSIEPTDPANALLPGGRAAVVLERARTLDALGRRAEAFAELLSLTAAYDAAGIAPDTSFWHAWTLVLEWTASDPGTTARDSATARGSLARLRTRDPALGGEPWAARLRAVEVQLSPRTP